MITIKELMRRDLYTLNPNDTLQTARELMVSKRIRHVPILDEAKNFVGLLTKHDVLSISVSTLADIDKSERDELESSIPISEVMTMDIIGAEEDTDLLEAAKYMLSQKNGCLPIFRQKELVGMLTEADFVRLAAHLLERLAEREAEESVE